MSNDKIQRMEMEADQSTAVHNKCFEIGDDVAEKSESEGTISNETQHQSKDISLATDESSSKDEHVDVAADEDVQCIFFNSTTFLCFLCVLVIAQSCVVIGYGSAIQTSLQKQFGLTTNQYGVVVSSFEYTSIPSVVLISFFGHRRNRARLIGYGSLFIAVGCIIYVLPFLISLRNGVAYSVASMQSTSDSVNSTNDYVCNVRTDASGVNASTCVSTSAADATFSSAMFAVLIVAQLVLGIGSSPIYTLGPTYLYDALPKSLYATLISLVYACGALGPALGFLMGALCLTIFITPWLSAPQSESAFLGAWWIGLLVCCGLSLAGGIPLIFFPKRLRMASRNVSSDSTGLPGDSSANGSSVTIIGKKGKVSYNNDKRPQQLEEPPVHSDFGNKRGWTEIGLCLKRILSSRIWITVTVCLVAENSIVTGFVTYLSKYLQTVFNVATSNASIIAGVILIPAAVTGFLAGGVITQRVLLDAHRIALYLVGVSSITLVLLVPLAFLHCDEPLIAGVTTVYPTQGSNGPLYDTLQSLTSSLQLRTESVDSNYSLYASCSASCSCATQQFSPVCANVAGNRISFYSACFAGCSVASDWSYTTQSPSTTTNYYNCSCVPNSYVSVGNSTAFTGSTVTAGLCDTTCSLLAPFLIIMFMIVFLISSAQNAVLILTLQSAVPDDRSFALGVQNFFVRLAALIPAPIYFGAIFDSWCILWSAADSCDSSNPESADASGRYCLLTDIVALPYVIITCTILLKFVSLAACIGCWLVARNERSVDLDGTNASVLSSTPSCVSDLPSSSRDNAVRYTVRDTDNSIVAYRSNALPTVTASVASPSVTLLGAHRTC